MKWTEMDLCGVKQIFHQTEMKFTDVSWTEMN